MNNSIIERCELLLERMEALEERSTKGEWEILYGGNFTRVGGPGYCQWTINEHYLGGPLKVAEVHWDTNEDYSSNPELAAANARLIAFAHNHSKTEIALVRGLLKVRKTMSDTFGGMGKGSAIWSNTAYDKGHTAGVLSALTAFDKEHNEFLSRWADSTEAELGKLGA